MPPAVLFREAKMTDVRVGLGIDVHRLVKGRRLVLGGVAIPSELGLLGHSDADVLTHAVCDALLGAAGLGDIGMHYPNTDERYRDMESLRLLGDVVEKVRDAGYEVVNVDATVVAERPELAPHFPAMRANLARCLGVALTSTNLKATTSEAMGAIGRGEGMAAWAVCLIRAAAGCRDT
jgi:2-C-methyl-D-erythritol 2,4-cyclodiphosphate synthase